MIKPLTWTSSAAAKVPSGRYDAELKLKPSAGEAVPAIIRTLNVAVNPFINAFCATFGVRKVPFWLGEYGFNSSHPFALSRNAEPKIAEPAGRPLLKL